MYDIQQLENEWKKYRRKKLKPWYITLLIVTLIAISSVLILMNGQINFSSFKSYFDTKNQTLNQEENVNYDQEKKVQKNVLLNSALDRLETKENLIAVMEKSPKKLVNILVDVPLLDDTNPTYEDVSEDKPKVQLDIVESTSVTAYKDVERRFLQSHDIDDALFLARSYYKKGDYKKAEYWALETNKIDENSEESLFIFVKSKVKLGRRNEAVTILTDYIKMTNSQEAKKLLYMIQNNKL